MILERLVICIIFVLFASKGAKCVVKLSLLHTNDMHARFKEVDRYLGVCKEPSSLSCFGGFARLYEEVQRCREEAQRQGRSTIFLNAGDNFQGTPYYSFFKWKIMAQFMNVLNVDAMSLGNHEFDDNIRGLAPYLQNVTAPVVCCNMDWSKEPSLQMDSLKPSIVLDVGEEKVGIIGYLTPKISKGNLGNLKILDEISSIKAEAQKLKKEGIKILIALGHSGYDKDLEIAKEVSDIDLVVGAHTHSFLYTGEPPDVEKPVGEYPTTVTQASGKRVPVVQAFFGTKYLGHLDLDFDNKGDLISFSGAPILLRGNMTQSSIIMKMLQPYENGIAETKRIIGYTHVFLNNSNNNCKVSECNIGNMITDAYVDYAVQHCGPNDNRDWTLAAIGMTQAGSIRSSVDAVSGGRNGSITLEDIITVSPFGNRIVVIRLNGSEILQALEHGVAQLEFVNTAHVKNLLQVSGLRVKYNINRKPGQRVVDVEVLCADCKIPHFENLILEKEYGVVFPEYIANGGGGFDMLSGHKLECVSNDTDYMIISTYIQRYSPLNPRVESRITFILENKQTNAVMIVIVLLVSVIVGCLIFVKMNYQSHSALPYITLRTHDVTAIITIQDERRKLIMTKQLSDSHETS